MRKFLSILLIFSLSAIVSCSRDEGMEDIAGVDVPYPVEGKPVTITFDVPMLEPATKSLGEGGELKSLHLAVFGGSGYLKEYVEAHPVSTTDYTYQTTDKDNNTISRTVPCYTYTVTLTLSDSPRTVHFLGNGPAILPFGYDNAVMPVQLSANGEMGYWQILSLPDGIKAKRNGDGDFIDKNGDVIPEGGTGYIADDETERKFQAIPLIRNWAKIVLTAEDDSNFTPVSMAVVNVPNRGSMAPYSAATGFITEYETRSFTWLDDEAKYPANLPIGTTFNDTIPPAGAFYGPVFGEKVAAASGGAVYLYERPAPSARIPASYVIIYGYYDNPIDQENAGYYFYKVDLMETRKDANNNWISRYYPVFRNFKYQIDVRKVMSAGHATPEAAASSAGSADVSADINTSHLTDISDGIGRLHVTPWISHTFTREYGEDNPVDILQAFFTQSANGDPDMVASSVKVELLPPEDGGAPILYNLSIDPPSVVYNTRGWRTIHFCSAAPGRTVRSQAIRVTATHEYGRLYRDILITIQPVQPMKVSCDQRRIPSVKGTGESVSIRIPDGLVESMFPLQFTIEAEALTLTPDNTVSNNNLPVVYGTSISENDGYAGKQAFQFVRTLTWEEYLSLTREEDEEEQIWRVFTCWFKTNCDESGTTVWVKNEYFDKVSDSFVNVHDKTFQNLHFTIPIPQERDVNIPLTFEMTEDPEGNYPEDYPVITITPQGLRLPLENGVTQGDDPGTYFYKPTSHVVNLTFISTTSYADEFSVELTAAEYKPGHVRTYQFTDIKFVDGHPFSTSTGGWQNNSWSNVAWGYVNSDPNKNVLLSYRDDPAQPNTPITVSQTNLTLYKSPSGPRSATGDQDYHEVEFRTTTKKSYADVEVTISSPGYVTQTIRTGRFSGNIRTMRVTSSNAFKKDNTYNFTQGHPTFTYAEDQGNIRVTFSEISSNPNGYVSLAAGGTYTIDIESLKTEQQLLYADLWFAYTSNVLYAPESITASVGTVTRYPGDNRQFVWSVPKGYTSGQLTITAPANREVRLSMMYVKSFNIATDGTGGFYENGVKL